MEAAEFVRVLQQRQGHIIAAPEEIAFLNEWIDRSAFEELAKKLAKTNYGRRLLESLMTRSG